MSGKYKCPDKGYCLYAAEYMTSLLSALAAETEGVKYSDDIEYVHRCRVATRRLRAAMSVFEECFPKKEFGVWLKQIKGITGSLGEARDRDVQVDFLKGFLSSEEQHGSKVFFIAGDAAGKTNQANVSETAIIPVYSEDDDRAEVPVVSRIVNFFRHIFSPGTVKDKNGETALAPEYNFRASDPYTAGIECLITRLEQKRKSIQPEVIKSIESFEKSKTAEKMGTYLRAMIVEADLNQTDIHSPYSFEKAFYNITLAEEGLYWYERFLKDPSLVKRHHEMRISAKKFRYTIETYSGLYEGELKDQIKVMKKLQDYLGDMHDCDVWAAFLDDFIDEERKRNIEFFGNDRFFMFVLPGLNFLKENRISKRTELYTELLEYWDGMKKEHFREDLGSVISLPLQSSLNRIIDSSPEDSPIHIALIGDVHANLPALEAVLADAKERGAAAVINTGDFIGYGAFPDQTVSKIRAEHIISVIGNYDLSVLKSRTKKKSLPKNRHKRFAMEWAYKELSDENKRYLRLLPKNLSLMVKGMSLYVTHGSPDSIKDYINETTPNDLLRSYISGTGADFIITGHTHTQYAKKIDDTWFINTGSVGRPDDGDPRACYAMLSLNPFSLYHVRVPYDVERAVEEIYRKNLPESFARIFREGKPLDIIMYSD
ncbi:CHAD domain-containing protein [Methanolacinia petrolearia]|uniref:CHAD domain-containing protein n=1 Tax=Methanolacinia petrolearia TaxID=54120 RepID=UPI003BAA39A1